MNDRETLETIIEFKEAHEARLKRDLETYRNQIEKTEAEIERIQQQINLLHAFRNYPLML